MSDLLAPEVVSCPECGEPIALLDVRPSPPIPHDGSEEWEP